MKRDHQTSASPKQRSAGRPRSLTLEDVLDAVIDMGFEGLSMTALATKLGVGIATIYTYVANRDELVRLAATHYSKRRRLDDLGQDWRDLIRDHASRTFEFCAAQPQLIAQHMQGLMLPDAHLDYTESMLAALVRRGFTVSAAYRLYSSINGIVFGAVVREAYVRSAAAAGYGHEGAVRRLLAERRLDELPRVRDCTDFADASKAFPWKDTVERIIESYEREFAGRPQSAGN
jgi:AcrR family transcriptional regulator